MHVVGFSRERHLLGGHCCCCLVRDIAYLQRQTTPHSRRFLVHCCVRSDSTTSCCCCLICRLIFTTNSLLSCRVAFLAELAVPHSLLLLCLSTHAHSFFFSCFFTLVAQITGLFFCLLCFASPLLKVVPSVFTRMERCT